MTNVVAIQDVRETMAAKKEHLEAVYSLTRLQDALIVNLDVTGLMENLNARQAYLDAVDDLELRLPDRRTLLMNHECAQLAVEINDVIDRIQKLDAHNQQKARDCLVFLKGQTKKASEGRRAGTGYDNRPADMGATYFDSKK